MKPIPEMTPDEVRVACAEAVGWRLCVLPIDYDTFSGKQWYELLAPNGLKVIDTVSPDIVKSVNWIPNFPEDANAALTLCDWMKRKGYFSMLCDDYEDEDTKQEEWNCRFIKGFPGDVGHEDHEACAPTLPLAICRAFLAANLGSVAAPQPPADSGGVNA